jgi:peptidyl-prolyl cis-trans isomerase SurA
MYSKFLLRASLLAVSLSGPTLLSLQAAAPDKSVPASTSDPNIKIVEMIVAKVNGEIITKTELDHQHALLAAELAKQNPTFTHDQLEALVKEKEADELRGQIDELLLVQKAKELNISVDAEVTKRFAQLQADSKLIDPEEFHRWVQEGSGMPYEDYRNSMKNSLLTQRLISQEVAYKIQLPQSELHDYYDKHKSEFVREEQVYLSELLIAPKSSSDADVAAAEKKAKDIAARARKGEKFGDLARAYSDAPSASQDGQLGAYKRGDLRKEIEEVVFKANRGFITEPMRTQNGWVILKVDERHEAGQAAFEDVQNEIMDKLYAPRMQPEVRKYLTKLREDAFIEIRAGYVDSGAAPGKDTSWRDPASLKPETITKAEVAANKKHRILGVIPRRTTNVSSSDPSASKTATPAAAPPAPAATPAAASSPSSSSSTPAAPAPAAPVQ